MTELNVDKSFSSFIPLLLKPNIASPQFSGLEVKAMVQQYITKIHFFFNSQSLRRAESQYITSPKSFYFSICLTFLYHTITHYFVKIVTMTPDT